MPSSPSPPKLPPLRSPTPRRVAMESEEARRRQKEAAKRRTGWASTILTRGGVGSVQTGKAKVLGV